MKKALAKRESSTRRPRRPLFHRVNGERVDGRHYLLHGDCYGLWGDCTGLRGICTGLRGDCSCLDGDCSGLRGDCTGLGGDCSELCGDLDACELSESDRDNGVVIRTLVES